MDREGSADKHLASDISMSIFVYIDSNNSGRWSVLERAPAISFNVVQLNMINVSLSGLAVYAASLHCTHGIPFL